MSLLRKARLYCDTVRYLRPVQVYGRIAYRLSRPKPDFRPAPPKADRSGGEWVIPAPRRESMIGEDKFCFLNDTRSLEGHGWDDLAVPKLWRYNIHYFDDLNALEAGGRQAWHEALVVRWIAENPPGSGSGWEPYPTSLRIVNWVKWTLCGHPLSPEAQHSLAVQARWLTRRLEYHLLGNHLFANAKALVFAGCYFSGNEADSWLRQGLDILSKEVPEQFLADGGHFELSTMYHALALEDVLDLINVLRAAGRQVPDYLTEQVAPTRRWLAAMTHPDGEIGFFNDAAIGIAPSPGELHAYAIRLGFPLLKPPPPGCTHLRDSGYLRLQDDRAVVLIDVARVGPDYLPGHAHADTLSFELSVDGRRVIVNSGTSVYGDDSERLRQRGTAAHSTVAVNALDSSEVWSGFRVARRARPQDLSIEQVSGGWRVVCAHDGYQRLPDGPVHQREWHFRQDQLRVDDRLDKAGHPAKASFHLAPGLEPLMSANSGRAMFPKDGLAPFRWQVETGSARIVPSTWHPEFGLSVATNTLELELEGGKARVTFSWPTD
jgi:uncharacterized heparinase superfamily protein